MLKVNLVLEAVFFLFFFSRSVCQKTRPNMLMIIFFLFVIFFVAFNAGWQRALVADYGIPLMVVFWTGMSYTVPSKVPSTIPRRLVCPLPWESESLYHWTVIMVSLHILCIFFLSSCETEQVLSHG